MLVIGAVLVFLGYVVLGISDFSFATLPTDATYGSFVGIITAFVIAEFIIGIGFLVALLGLAVKP